MTDRELLEAAAKAAGLPVEFDEGTCNGWWPCGRTFTGDVDEWWNPLTDDGDAFRLAVKLKLTPLFHDDCVEVYRFAEAGAEDYGSDPCAATRRAIVRAAAAMAPK